MHAGLSAGVLRILKKMKQLSLLYGAGRHMYLA